MIQAKGINKSFHKNEVLKSISLEVVQGEVVCIIGPSGSGKSTFLRTINLLEIPDEGELHIFGKQLKFNKGDKVNKNSPRFSEIRKEVGMVFQSFNLFPHLTVLENVIEGPTIVRKIDKNEAIIKAREVLEKVGLSDKENSYPSQLSGGQQQRVAIARALAMEPKAILFDEPTSALDPELVGEVLNVIKKLASEGMTMIIVTHEMEFAKNVADRVVFMENGHIIESGPPQELFTNPKTDRLRKFLTRLSDKG